MLKLLWNPDLFYAHVTSALEDGTEGPPLIMRSLLPHIWLVLLHATFALATLMGLAALFGGVRLLWTGGEPFYIALLVIIIGGVALCIGLGFFYNYYVKAPSLLAHESRIKERYPDQPWMLRSEWVKRKLVHSEIGTVIFVWIFVAGWWGLLGLIGYANFDEISAAFSESWSDLAFASLFVAGGLVGLAIAIMMTRKWRRFGRSEFAIETLPGYLGENFRGRLSTTLPLDTKELAVELICESVVWVRTSGGEGRTSGMVITKRGGVREMIAGGPWERRKGKSVVPIAIAIPEDLPGCQEENEDQEEIRWRLEVYCTDNKSQEAAGQQDDGDEVDGDGLNPPLAHCGFEVPVFRRRRGRM